jgi:hypothetical protein
MYTISFPNQTSFKLNIHNQCWNVDLVSPIYITNDLECYRSLNHKVYARDKMSSGFIIRWHGEPYSALIYKIQRRWLSARIKTCKDTATVAQLLVVWEISESKKLYANTFLVEHDGGFDWDKNALEALLYHRNFDRSRLCPDSATETWLLNDNTALMTTVEIINEDCVLNITISEVEKDNNTRIPAHINSEL